jgi:isoquinoline 1-oxidoreductase
MGTFGSQSTRFTGVHVRKAAATARQALLELASARLDLPVDQLRCESARVVSLTDPGHSISYADLLQSSTVVRDLIDDVAVTPAASFTVMGHDSRRPDGRARVTGEAVYSQDVIRPGMLFASVLRPPSYGARLRDVDAAAAERMPGVVAVVHEGSLAAVLADSDEHAEMGLRVLRAEWEEQAELHLSQWDLPGALLEHPRDPVVIQDEGDVSRGLAAAPNTLEATYYVPYVSTVPMEPRAAVAEWDGDQLTVWAGTQRPFGIRSELAAELGIDESHIRVIAPEIGGGFGAKSLYRPAFEAAKLARIAGRPVRVAYTRAEEMEWATFRPAALITIRSGFDDSGKLLAWDFHAIHTTTDRPMIGQRGADSPYGAPDTLSVVSAGPAPLRPGSYRSLGGAVNHFARESHLDEIASAIGMDPVELRLKNLEDRRYRRVLEAAANQFGWQSAPPGSGRGVGTALGWDVGSYSAECVQVRVRGKEVVVERVSASIDCGLIFNPEGVRNQMEGSIVMGLGTALYEGAEFEGGRLLNGSFARYRVPRIHDVPQIEVIMVGDDDEPPTGAGEPGIVPIAPAIANAVFDATRKRIRELPLQRQI